MCDGMAGVSLGHYRRRLETIESSPELTGSSMAPVIIQEARKKHARVDQLMRRMHSPDDSPTDEDIALVESALISYKSDIIRALGDAGEYYRRLVDVNTVTEIDIKEVDALMAAIKRGRSST